jgi:O-antigen ligase
MNRSTDRRASDERLGNAGTITLLAWGVFALGALEPWGYLPLIAGMMAIGVANLLMPMPQGSIGRGLTASLVAFAGAVCLQLVPLPFSTVQTISPSALVSSSHAAGNPLPLSTDPRSTALGVIFIVAFAFFFAGSVRTMRASGVRQLGAGIVCVGTIVALTGIAEASGLWIGMYRAVGWPLPPDSFPHGPFSSRNHYAGWMLMTLALTLGYLCAALQEWRTRPGRTLLLQCAALVMSVAVVQTRSRAGILGLVLAVATMGVLLMRQLSTAKTRIAVALSMGLLVLTAVVVTGVQPIVSRFLVHTWSTAHGRVVIWRQAAAIVRDFPVTGAGFNTYQNIVASYPTAGLDEPYEGAHNDYLQLAAEGGLLVGLPFLATVGFFVHEARQRLREASSRSATEWLRIGALVGLLLMAIQETVDFSLQVPGIAALFVALAAIAVHRATPEKRNRF